MPAENLATWSPDEIRTGLFAAIVGRQAEFGFSNVDPMLILSQAQHETGNFRSDLLLSTDNAFGMKFPRVRQTTAVGEDNGYAVYDTLADSVTDYLMRQRNFNIPNTADPVAYIEATVASGYAGDPDYGEKWAAVYAGNAGVDVSQFEPQQAGVGGGAVWVLVGALVLNEMSK